MIQTLQIHSGITKWQWASIVITCHRQTCWNVGSRSYNSCLIQKTCTFEYAAPIKGVSTTTYWQLIYIWWLLWKSYTTWYLAGGSHRLICIKPKFTLYLFSQTILSKFYFLRVEIITHTLHTGRACSSRRNSTKLEQQNTTTPRSAWLGAPT
jgi:hypothetical protein